MIQVLIALLVIVVVARLILKGYRAEPVLFIAGLVLMICTALTGWGSVLPKGVASTGISFLDPFEVMRDLLVRVPPIRPDDHGAHGTAHYMDHIGANEAVVRVVTKPLRALRSPHVLLFFSYLLASLLQLAHSIRHWASRVADGDDVPIMLGLGFRRPQPLGLLPPLGGIYPDGPSMLSGFKAVNMDVVEYVVYHQGTRSAGNRAGRRRLPFLLAAALRP